MLEFENMTKVRNEDNGTKATPSYHPSRYGRFGGDDIKNSKFSLITSSKTRHQRTRSCNSMGSYEKQTKSELKNVQFFLTSFQNSTHIKMERALHGIQGSRAFVLYGREDVRYARGNYKEYKHQAARYPQEVLTKEFRKNATRFDNKGDGKWNQHKITNKLWEMENFESTLTNPGNVPPLNYESIGDTDSDDSIQTSTNIDLSSIDTDEEFINESILSFNFSGNQDSDEEILEPSVQKFEGKRFPQKPISSRASTARTLTQFGPNYPMSRKPTCNEHGRKKSFAKDIKSLLRVAKEKVVSNDLKMAHTLCVKALHMLSTNIVPRELLKEKTITDFWSILALVYKKSADYKSAERCYRFQLAIAEKGVMPFVLKSSLYDLYEVLVVLKDFHEALNTLTELKAIAVYAEETVKIYHETAHCHLMLNQLESARSNAEKALENLPQELDNDWIFKLKLLLGKIEITAGNFSVSKMHYQDALEFMPVDSGDVTQKLYAILKTLNSMEKKV